MANTRAFVKAVALLSTLLFCTLAVAQAPQKEANPTAAPAAAPPASTPAPAPAPAAAAAAKDKDTGLAAIYSNKFHGRATASKEIYNKDALTAANQYLETASPWKRARAGESAAVAASLYCAAEAVRIAALLLTPVLPERSAEALRRLGCPADASQAGGLAWGGLVPGSPVSSGDPLFPRIE